MTKSQIIRAYALKQVGSPYVYGATGQPCTPAYRRARMAQYPTFANAIRSKCPVLSAKQVNCSGCRYNGKKAYDCAQLTRRAAEAAGLSLPSGSTNQWKNVKWLKTGTIGTLPPGQVAFVYNVKPDGKVPHTGIALGDGTVVDARGHDYGVVHKPLTSYRNWTRWAILPGMEMNGETKMTLQMGSVGSAVKVLQQELLKLHHDLGRWGADGKFGASTEKAVKEFQEATGLKITGIWGDSEQETLDEINNRPPANELPTAQEIDRAALLIELQGLAQRQLTIIGALIEGR